MEYFIALGTNPDELIKKVKAFIKDGWVPQGGVTAYIDSNQQSDALGGQYMMFAQALVKKEVS